MAVVGPLRLWGWFDDATQKVPTYDPPYDAPCPYCFAPLTPDDVRTVCIMHQAPSYAKRSYFYRVHRTCHTLVSLEENNAMDGRIFDAIARAGE